MFAAIDADRSRWIRVRSSSPSGATLTLVSHLAIVFPGRAYSHDHPVLLTLSLALAAMNATIEPIEYSVLVDEDPKNDGPFQDAVRRDVERLLAQHDPDRLTLVGKSLGTLAMAEVARSVNVPIRTDAIWLTPIFGDDDTFEAALRCEWASLYVVGLADSYHVPERQAELRGTTVELEGVGHGLLVDRDAARTIDTWRSILDAATRFLSSTAQ